MIRSLVASISLFVCIFLCQANQTVAQVTTLSNLNQTESIKGKDVSSLSDAQVEQVRTEIESRGLTTSQAIQAARARGASEKQIQDLTNRLLGSTEKTETKESASDAADNTTKEYSTKSSASSTDVSKVYGHYLFNNDNLTFNPNSNMPVPGNYTLNYGDQIVISVWGNSQQEYLLTVSKSGSIKIPRLGTIYVAGLSFEEAKRTIMSQLSGIYNDMLGDEPQTFADVTMGVTQAIQVNIVGEAITPGTYTLPGTATVFNALYLSGGPNSKGSFRNIQVLRNNKVLKTIDVYDYLIDADLSGDISLKNGDVIYIPVYENYVTATGGFKRNGIYEIKNGETVNDLIKFTGGFIAGAYTDRIQVERSTVNGYKLLTLDKASFTSFSLNDGDGVNVEEKLNGYQNRVSINGAVYRPGNYELQAGMSLSNLITQAGGPIPDYFANRGLITRLDAQRYPTIIPFDIDEVLNGSGDMMLQAEDQILIKSIYDIGENKFVRIEGEVVNDGEYRYNKDMMLKDLIFLAGGLKESASEASIEIARRRSHEESEELSSELVSLYTLSIDRDLKLSAEDESILIEPYDYVYIRRAPSYEEQKTVTILGEVKYPGKYAISNKDERISDLIERAGGLTPYAYLDAAYMTRGMNSRAKANLQRTLENRSGSSNAVYESVLDENQSLELQLSEIVKHPGDENDYILLAGDVISIPIRNEEIWVNGGVLNPSGLAYDSKKLKNYINAAGGFAQRSKKGKTYVVYANGSSASTKGFIFRRYPKVKPGSQIIVPMKPERNPTSPAIWIAGASTMASLAVTVVALFK